MPKDKPTREGLPTLPFVEDDRKNIAWLIRGLTDRLLDAADHFEAGRDIEGAVAWVTFRIETEGPAMMLKRAAQEATEGLRAEVEPPLFDQTRGF